MTSSRSTSASRRTREQFGDPPESSTHLSWQPPSAAQCHLLTTVDQAAATGSALGQLSALDLRRIKAELVEQEGVGVDDLDLEWLRDESTSALGRCSSLVDVGVVRNFHHAVEGGTIAVGQDVS